MQRPYSVGEIIDNFCAIIERIFYYWRGLLIR